MPYFQGFHFDGDLLDLKIGMSSVETDFALEYIAWMGVFRGLHRDVECEDLIKEYGSANDKRN
ncbi:hypothetical protein BCR33DRAFT_710970 [Rhizoclosmatium globosum]|uniref:Uncharacterized protein n=1 Tax=Rhizoclosmatium globosum TaxID=329046 RepID=A0A1Y2D2Q1_9FUNG|nr:hypothetical protein BCR33DRAFT_710970 [Rhizoclosmatium globosum]|eukprot:ORY53571.1 hypothetical protein BCR33DRAFT_710970 [Rhizoclosmatium globosum]